MSQVQEPPVAITTGRDSKGQAEPRLPSQAEVDEYEREATELGAYREHPRDSRDGDDADGSRYDRIGNVRRPRNDRPRWYQAISSFWTHYIRLSVPHDDCRDHLANERTFLAYLRTSLALSTAGVTVSQLLRLAHSIDPNQFFGYYVLGRPLGALFQVAAMILTLIGAHRFWRQQMSMARGKVWASGWEIYVIWSLLLVLMVGVTILLVVVDIDKESV